MLKIDYLIGTERQQPKGGIEKEEIFISFELDGVSYLSKGDYFEDIFLEFEKQFKNNYYFKNCFGCLFSDYNVYGQNSFGTLMCYIDNKEAYLNASSKAEYGNLTDYKYVQETSLCNKFQKRIKDTGYRG